MSCGPTGEDEYLTPQQIENRKQIREILERAYVMGRSVIEVENRMSFVRKLYLGRKRWVKFIDLTFSLPYDKPQEIWIKRKFN